MKTLLDFYIKTMEKFKTKLNSFLDEKVTIFSHDYSVEFDRPPTELEIKRFKKDIVMKYSIRIYLPIMLILFFLYSGVFK